MPVIRKLKSRIIDETMLRRMLTRWRLQRELEGWDGASVPPPHLIKQRVVMEYGRRFQANAMVETGTYLGVMVDAARRDYPLIISIELDTAFARRAGRLFRHAPNVHIIQGESGRVLAALAPRLPERTVYWLDAHWSGGDTARADLDTPIITEVTSIFKQARNPAALLIDDAHLFVGQDDYPTIEQFRGHVTSLDSTATFEIADNIIRIVPGAITS